MKSIPVAVLLCTLVLSGCGVAANPPMTSAPPMARSASPQAASFEAWKAQFRSRALAEGIRPQVLDAAFGGVTKNLEVVRLDGAQAEFTKPIWEYLDSAVSADRINTGRAKAGSLDSTLSAIERRFGVQRQYIVAIWGMETNYGGYRGSIPVIESLSTLAYEGRRRDFAEEQLIAALKIIQAGDITPQRMNGSWAGAMGHTQFIPTSYLSYAVDFTGDGRRDVWSDNPTDALASAANYLASAGWEPGRPWGVEVRLPQGFDYSQADQANRRPVAEWRARGVTAVDGSALPDHGSAAILVPAGASGPAFAVYQNFFVIKKYNNATSYAMGVGHLGDRIAGAGPFRAPWPRSERTLSRSETQDMQRRLTAIGYDTGGTDGIVGPDTMNAIRQFQAANDLTPDGFASAALLQKLR